MEFKNEAVGDFTDRRWFHSAQTKNNPSFSSQEVIGLFFGSLPWNTVFMPLPVQVLNPTKS